MTPGEFFGTLQEAITAEWRKHLQTGKYSKHMALDDFYTEMPEKVDSLIEAWQADNDIVEDYSNVLDDSLDALAYMQALKKHVRDGRSELLKDNTELESMADDILGLIDSTIYKLKHLTESMISLSAYINENLNDLDLIDESLLDMDFDVTDASVNPLIVPMSNFGKWGQSSSWKSGADVGQDIFDQLWSVCEPKLLKKLGFVKVSAADSKRFSDKVRIMWYENGTNKLIYINFGQYHVDWPAEKPMTAGKWANIMQIYPKHAVLNSGMTQPGSFMSGGKRKVFEMPDDIAKMMFETLGLKYSTRD